MKLSDLRRLVMCVAFLLGSLAVAAPPAGGYHLLKKYTLGGEGRWDYLTFEDVSRRLFIARANSVIVVDADSGKQLGEILDTPVAHGVVLATDLGRGFITSGGADKVTIFDLKTLQVLDTVKVTGTGPDGIVYDPVSRSVFAFNGHSSDATAIDGATGKVLGTIPLGGKPEAAQADGKGHLFNNLIDKSEVIEIDIKKLSVIGRWSLAPCKDPVGMGIDRDHMRLFIGCRNFLSRGQPHAQPMMAIVDANTGKVIATPPIGGGVDANAFDPGTGLAFSSNDDGTLTVVHEDSPDKFRVVENVKTQRGARTMTLDPKTHNVFLVTADLGPALPPTPEVPDPPHPSIFPGTFVLLVFGR